MTTRWVMRQRAVYRLAVALVLASVTAVFAQDYPAKPIRLLIDFPAGGASDSLARVVGQRLTEALGQPLVYDNRPGANGIIAYGLTAKANPDGYTLGILSTPFPLNAALGRKLSYDTLKDFTPISFIANYPNVLVVHPSVPARSVQEFVGFAKSKAGAMSYASGGSGSPQHLAMELFRGVAGFESVHVPYTGSATAITDVIGGRVQANITVLPTAVPHLKAGRLRVLGVLSQTRAVQLPEVPTFIESGYAVIASGWGGIGAPAGIPRHVVTKLHAEIARAVSAPEVRERIGAVGGEPRFGTPEEFAKFIRDEVTRWIPVVRASGATAEN